MTSPLAAPVAGMGLVEDPFEIASGIRSGSWVDASLGGVGMSLEALSLVLDPLGSLMSWGVGWLLEHVEPLREALDHLAGDAAAVSAQSSQWQQVAALMSSAHAGYTARVQADTAGWSGEATEAYRAHAGEQLAAMQGIGVAAGGIASAVMGTGLLVALVREIVRDLIADFVATLAVRLPQWLAMEGFTLGIATPAVASQVASLVSSWAGRIRGFVRGLLTSLRNLLPSTDGLRRILDALVMSVGDMARKSPVGGHADATPAAGGSPAAPRPDGDGGDGGPPSSSDPLPEKDDAPREPDGSPTTSPRDVHGALQTSTRQIDADYVWRNGTMYVQEDGQIVKVLDNGNGTYDVVVRDLSNPTGRPTTSIADVPERSIQRKIDKGIWE
ncbi:hypothetical protein AMIS_58850 [Actinoplanes missouriensis 431]|uniref:WXG100 family type VII secretion target n=1 Tax=Actinoplanes missouriensis (strain ATCC 14538 / DSM 43046 / CBS 188.64 / JCM 3121 / NBRC 102363 / NCIMB 12654 / NRRL B-3342 / UNCC 431) TaxID=512565 RepID=I0HDL8_ACTM4|nr:hypothetical protein [Actinoplanes missouriensis]BAL91105.1 hypothetical protein AMIS_58850 [Actinoplanes missouriensis 431]